MTYRARVRPWVRTTSSKDSTHSLVSSGSMSGSWVGSPSLMIEKRWRPEATGDSSHSAGRALGLVGWVRHGIADAVAVGPVQSGCPPLILVPARTERDTTQG